MKLNISKIVAIFSFLVLLGCKATEGIKEAKEEISISTMVQELPGTDLEIRFQGIPGGSFLLGSAENEINHEADEGPQKEVLVDAFWMSTFEIPWDVYRIYQKPEFDREFVSQKAAVEAEGKRFRDAFARPSPPYEEPSFGMGTDGFPAVSMTQYGAMAFCKWLSEKTGKLYRLPTEAEWEYACKAGNTNKGMPLDSVAWYYENADDAYHKIGSKNPNAWGLHDMLGNVSEWTLDQYQTDYYTELENGTVAWRKPTKLHPRTVRGGSYDDDPEECRCSNRIESSMKWKRRDPQIPKSFWWNTDSPFVGFRIVTPQKPMTSEEIKAFWVAAMDG